MRYLCDGFLQIGLGVIWTPLFVLTVVYDLWLEWKDRRERAKLKTNFPKNLRGKFIAGDMGLAIKDRDNG